MYKLYINGAFVRSESGRSDPIGDDGEFGANVARASRKDARDAVVAARNAAAKWSTTAPATRGLVLYRLAEMIEARRAEFVERVRDGSGVTPAEADREVAAAIDRTVWYAGWTDKFSALLSTRNPVAGPHFNASTAEPAGVVAVLAPDRPSLLGTLSVLLPPLVSGNAVVLVASESDPRTAIALAEAIATSDLPAGTVNVLTGSRDELGPVLAKHMDVNAIAFEDGNALADQLEIESVANVKRVHRFPQRSPGDWAKAGAQSLDEVAAYCEIKTIWHPAGV